MTEFPENGEEMIDLVQDALELCLLEVSPAAAALWSREMRAAGYGDGVGLGLSFGFRFGLGVGSPTGPSSRVW